MPKLRPLSGTVTTPLRSGDSDNVARAPTHGSRRRGVARSQLRLSELFAARSPRPQARLAVRVSARRAVAPRRARVQSSPPNNAQKRTHPVGIGASTPVPLTERRLDKLVAAALEAATGARSLPLSVRVRAIRAVGTEHLKEWAHDGCTAVSD